MKITDVVLFTIRGHWRGAGYPAGSRQAQALDVYEEFNRRPEGVAAVTDEEHPISGHYVEIQTDEGVTGLFGPIDETQVFIIRQHLRPFLIGRDPLATEALQDQMLRMHRHGRSGLFLTGVSVIDCALWDLKGKAWQQPLYRLLGGPTRQRVPAYASMLGFSIEPDEAATVAREYVDLGFGAQKWFFRHGPADGAQGLEKNLAMAYAVREVVGEYYPLMFDAYMGWDRRYACEMVRELEPMRPTWVEEPVPPERVEALAEIRAASGVPIATGEHVYTRWQVKELLVNGAVDYLQTDPDWTGGVTELVKICALASAFETPVVAHGHSLLAALHVAASQSPTTVPWVEYLIRHQANKQYFHKPSYVPRDGHLALPTLPGLGLVLDESRIEIREQI